MATMAPRDQSLFAPDPISNRSVSPKKLLIAVDDSKATIRVLQYVGALLRETPEVTITLFHVLNPMPRELMEHGGSENPDMEHQLGEQLRKDQQEWMQAEETLEYPILERARGRLSETGFPTDRVVLKLGYAGDLVDTILDEVRAGGYGTLVITKHGQPDAAHLFSHNIAERLSRDLSGVALWIIE
ncbi:MAG: universal stress protein [Nitrospira sp.]|nr:universal stress protein [Nitrospira sp.]MBX3339886.1 universal stress protein [Nitrospira sp.]MCC7473493.1 universal stress protein [Candidatus Nomurabacteria bacterium]